MTSEADIKTDFSTRFVDVAGLGRMHEGFFEAEDLVHADVSRGSAAAGCPLTPHVQQ